MPDRKPVLERRAVIGGAATVSAAAVAVSALPLSPQATVPQPADGTAAVPPAPGYRLTDHIRQYYAKARI